MKMEVKIGGKAFLIIIVLIAIGIVAWSASGYFVRDEDDLTTTSPTVTTISTEKTDLDRFANCLSEKGATMYGAEWCGACKSQKRMFGESFKYVNYVECPESRELCEEKGIRGYPTWIINDLPHVGIQEFETLSSLTGCSLS